MNNTLSTVETLARVQGLNRDRYKSDFWQDYALLNTVGRMIERQQYDAAYWIVRDILDEGGKDQPAGYRGELYELQHQLDGLRNMGEAR
jgi:hypothetical protein